MARGRDRSLLMLAVLACLAVMVTGVAAGTSPAVQNETGEADTVLLEINVDEQGDATWHARYRYRLETDNETTAFQNLQADIEENPAAYEQRYREGMLDVMTDAAESTGREMSLSSVTVEAETDPLPSASGEAGVVTYQFEWEGFANATEEGLRIGDAIHGLYLGPDWTLIFRWPESYDVVGSATPTADESATDRVRWEGERYFLSDEPDVEVREETDSGSAGDDPKNGTGGDDQPGGDRTESGGPPLLVIAAGVLFLLGLAGGGGFVVLRRYDGNASAVDGEKDAGTTESGGSNVSGAADRPPPELMSNEERVVTALEDNGGRMKQSELAAACDWHASKTSKVVSDLKDDGVIEVFRIGRENILTFPDQTLGEIDDE